VCSGNDHRLKVTGLPKGELRSGFVMRSYPHRDQWDLGLAHSTCHDVLCGSGQTGGRIPMKVRFPDGTVVMACSLAERRESNPDRDYGLYMDADWQPTWDAHVIPWADFGVPTDDLSAARAIVSAFKRAKANERLEIGCAGGLGRTGTVLACMAMLAGVPAKDAVGWVRANYNRDAIERPVQERWIRWFADRVAAGEVQT